MSEIVQMSVLLVTIAVIQIPSLNFCSTLEAKDFTKEIWSSPYTLVTIWFLA